MPVQVEEAVCVGIDLLADAPVQAVVFVELTINIGRAGFDKDQSVPRIVRVERTGVSLVLSFHSSAGGRLFASPAAFGAAG